MRPGLSVAISIISGGSRSFAMRERLSIVSVKKISKLGTVCIVYVEISEGWALSSPLDPPLASLIEVANVDSTV